MDSKVEEEFGVEDIGRCKGEKRTGRVKLTTPPIEGVVDAPKMEVVAVPPMS